MAILGFMFNCGILVKALVLGEYEPPESHRADFMTANVSRSNAGSHASLE